MLNKQTNIIWILLVFAVVILVVLSLYEVFLRPSEQIPTEAITPLTNYLGEDVLEYLGD